MAASLRYGRLSNMPSVPWVRPSHGSEQNAANGSAPRRAEFSRGFFDEQTDFPVARVVAERDGRAVGVADASLRAENQKGRLPGEGGRPAHAHVLAQAEDIAARPLGEHFGRERKRARGAGSLRTHTVDVGCRAGSEKIAVVHDAKL